MKSVTWPCHECLTDDYGFIFTEKSVAVAQGALAILHIFFVLLNGLLVIALYSKTGGKTATTQSSQQYLCHVVHWCSGIQMYVWPPILCYSWSHCTLFNKAVRIASTCLLSVLTLHHWISLPTQTT
jgi:hypothetical protein